MKRPKSSARLALYVGHTLLLLIAGMVVALKFMYAVVAFAIVLVIALLVAAFGVELEISRAFMRILETFLSGGAWVALLHVGVCVWMWRNFRPGWVASVVLCSVELVMVVFYQHPLLITDGIRISTSFSVFTALLTGALLAVHFLPENLQAYREDADRWSRLADADEEAFAFQD